MWVQILTAHIFFIYAVYCFRVLMKKIDGYQCFLLVKKYMVKIEAKIDLFCQCSFWKLPTTHRLFWRNSSVVPEMALIIACPHSSCPWSPSKTKEDYGYFFNQWRQVFFFISVNLIGNTETKKLKEEKVTKKILQSPCLSFEQEHHWKMPQFLEAFYSLLMVEKNQVSASLISPWLQQIRKVMVVNTGQHLIDGRCLELRAASLHSNQKTTSKLVTLLSFIFFSRLSIL